MKLSRGLYIKRSSIFLFLAYIQGLLGVVAAHKFLPEKYFNDSKAIRSFMDRVATESFGLFDSYANTAKFYRVLGFQYVDSELIEGLLNYTIVFVCIVIAYKLSSVPISKKIFGILLIWNIIIAIYMGQLSKEVIATVTITVQIVLIQKQSKGFRFWTILIIIAYAALFRKYWIIALYFTAAIFLMTTRNYNILGVHFLKERIQLGKYFIRLSIILKVMVVAIGFWLLLIVASLNHLYLTDTRTAVNVGRAGDPDAVTVINNVLTNNSFITDAANWIISWGRLLFPFEILPIGGFQHIAFIIWNSFSILYFILMVRFFKRYRHVNQTVEWCLAWIISFSFVQGIFEPDFGSFIKHEVVLFPMFFYLMLAYRGMKYERKQKLRKEGGLIESSHVKKGQPNEKENTVNL